MYRTGWPHTTQSNQREFRFFLCSARLVWLWLDVDTFNLIPTTQPNRRELKFFLSSARWVWLWLDVQVHTSNLHLIFRFDDLWYNSSRTACEYRSSCCTFYVLPCVLIERSVHHVHLYLCNINLPHIYKKSLYRYKENALKTLAVTYLLYVVYKINSGVLEK